MRQPSRSPSTPIQLQARSRADCFRLPTVIGTKRTFHSASRAPWQARFRRWTIAPHRDSNRLASCLKPGRGSVAIIIPHCRISTIAPATKRPGHSLAWRPAGIRSPRTGESTGHWRPMHRSRSTMVTSRREHCDARRMSISDSGPATSRIKARCGKNSAPSLSQAAH